MMQAHHCVIVQHWLLHNTQPLVEKRAVAFDRDRLSSSRPRARRHRRTNQSDQTIAAVSAGNASCLKLFHLEDMMRNQVVDFAGDNASKRRRCFFIAVAGVLLISSSVGAHNIGGIPEASFRPGLQIIASGFNSAQELTPTELVPFADGSGRMLVGTLRGTVRVIDAGGNLLPTPFMTQVQTGSQPPTISWEESGLTSIAFHPDYGDSAKAGYGKLYTLTREYGLLDQPGGGFPTPDFGNSGDHQSVIREWNMAANGNTISANVFSGTEANSREILRIGQPGPFHNVNDLAFGPDGNLYISMGDGGGSSSVAQNLGSIYGSILRIDPLGNNSANGQYGLPSDNPYQNDGNAATLGEIWARGMRNPYRMTFDRQTGDLFAADVGAGAWEEVDQIQRAGNFGWSFREGAHGSQPPGGSIDPIFEYAHNGLQLAVIGGFVYRGSLIPELQGKYVFADFGEPLNAGVLLYGDLDTGEIFELEIDASSPAGFAFTGKDGQPNLMPRRILSIGEDAAGELYLVAGQDPRRPVDPPTGYIVKIVPEPASLALFGFSGLLLLKRKRRVWESESTNYAGVVIASRQRCNHVNRFMHDR